MFDNPGDEVYFGEVYRHILQEPWLPGGGDVWSILGKSRRGSRPSLRGITGPNVSPSQEEVRRWFSSCAAAWRDLPWELPPDPTCDNRHDKKWWMEEKARRGLMCSYYDLYMRYCLRFALDTGCIPPANYLLKVDPPLMDIGCNKVYGLTFPNKCGAVSMVSGDGEFVAPSDWVSPKCGTEGELCFKDENGSFGFTTYKFSSDYWCTEFFWPDYNPTDIDPSVSKPVYVEGGVPPYTWSISGEGFSFTNPVTQEPVNSLYAAPGACGTCRISVLDICGNECSGAVLCSAGDWVLLCAGDNWMGSCALRKNYERFPNPYTKLVLGVGCHYSPFECIFASCGGYTAYLPEPAGVLKCGTEDWTGGCDDIGFAECHYYNVYLHVYEWQCPP